MFITNHFFIVLVVVFDIKKKYGRLKKTPLHFQKYFNLLLHQKCGSNKLARFWTVRNAFLAQGGWAARTFGVNYRFSAFNNAFLLPELRGFRHRRCFDFNEFILRRFWRKKRRFQKKIGRWFRYWRPILYTERVDAVQSYVNDFVHTFLRFFAKEFWVLRFFAGKKFRIYYMKVFFKEHSKKLWISWKKYLRKLKWVRKKKFNARQQISYYKRKVFIRKRFVVRRVLLGSFRYLVRRGSKYYSFLKFSSRLENLQSIYGLKSNYAGLKHLLDVIRSHSQKNYLSTFFGQEHFCLTLRRKKNNFYMTLIMGNGNVVFSLSSGRYLLQINEKKRNKKLRGSFKHFQEFLKKFTVQLRSRGVFNIKYFLRTASCKKRSIFQIIYTFLARGITVENILNVNSFTHSKLVQKRKLRRL